MIEKIVCLLASFVLGSVSIGGAQQAKKISRIGYLSSFDPAGEAARAEGIRRALREIGYLEGQNIAIEYRYADGKMDRGREFAAELVHLKVDMIVTAGGTGIIQAAKNATKTIPIVMTGGETDPVEAGLIESLARPGGNVTGFTNLARELAGKRLELLKEAVPKLVRVAALYDPANSNDTREVKELLPVAARALQLTLQSWEINGAGDFDRVFAALNKQRPDGLYLMGSPVLAANRKRIADFAIKSRLPSVSNSTYVQAGGLMSYNADQRTATGASPITSIGLSKVPSPPTCRWSSRPSSNWCSISRRRNSSA